MKLYSKKGDDGTTGLIGNVRVSKNDARVAAYGAVDETNAAIGGALAGDVDAAMAECLRRIQEDLFIIGAELATPVGEARDLAIMEEDVARLEKWIDTASEAAGPLSTFILPGGCQAAAALHLARGVCRRAERDVVTLKGNEETGEHVLVYLNRLGDLLFALARVANNRAGVADVPWIPRKS